MITRMTLASRTLIAAARTVDEIAEIAGVSQMEAQSSVPGYGTMSGAAVREVRDTAAELLNLYAQRATRQGHAFKFTYHDYEAFSAGFGFEETPDQAAAIGLAAAGLHLARHSLGARQVQIGHHHPRAGLGKSRHCRAADAAGRAGDQHHLAEQCGALRAKPGTRRHHGHRRAHQRCGRMR